MTKPRASSSCRIPWSICRRGGRIGRAQALVGSLLQIRPHSHRRRQGVVPRDRARTRAQATETLLELMAEYAQGRPFAHVAVLRADAAATAQELKGLIRARFDVPEERFLDTEIGPVIGTYVSPGTHRASFPCE